MNCTSKAFLVVSLLLVALTTSACEKEGRKIDKTLNAAKAEEAEGAEVAEVAEVAEGGRCLQSTLTIGLKLRDDVEFVELVCRSKKRGELRGHPLKARP